MKSSNTEGLRISSFAQPWRSPHLASVPLVCSRPGHDRETQSSIIIVIIITRYHQSPLISPSPVSTTLCFMLHTPLPPLRTTIALKPYPRLHTDLSSLAAKPSNTSRMVGSVGQHISPRKHSSYCFSASNIQKSFACIMSWQIPLSRGSASCPSTEGASNNPSVRPYHPSGWEKYLCWAVGIRSWVWAKAFTLKFSC